MLRFDYRTGAMRALQAPQQLPTAITTKADFEALMFSNNGTDPALMKRLPVGRHELRSVGVSLEMPRFAYACTVIDPAKGLRPDNQLIWLLDDCNIALCRSVLKSHEAGQLILPCSGTVHFDGTLSLKHGGDDQQPQTHHGSRSNP